MMSPKVRIAKQKVTLESEKTRLINVLWKAKKADITELPCSITCEEENGKVVIEADDTFIADIATSIRQVAYKMASCKVSQGDRYLCTVKGEQWIAEEFEKRDISAIICTKARVTYILAKDQDWLESANTSFKEIVTREMIDLAKPILPYFKSSEWNEMVKGFPTNYMVQVISDLEFARILVSGRRADVDCVIGYIQRLIRKMRPFDETSMPPNIIVVRGDIATFAQADVLVNAIGANENSLMGAGSVSESFLEAGGEKLQKEFEKSGAPINFGTDVTVTGTTGKIRAKKIFHAAIERMQSAMSLELLTSLIKTCLKKAEEMKLISIAFPTLGCGLLGYNQDDVSMCFTDAAKGSRLQIYIVAYTQDLYERFKNDFRAQEPIDLVQSTPSETAVSVVQELPPVVAPKTEVPVRTAPVFANLVFTSLSADLTRLIKTPRTASTVITEMAIVHPEIAQLNDEVAANIQSLQSPDVQVAIDKSESTITLTGAKDALVVMKQIIVKALTDDEFLQKKLPVIKKHVGVKEYLIALSSMPVGPRDIPKYWNNSGGQDVENGLHDTDSNFFVPKRLRLVKSSPVYNAVELLVKDTWFTAPKRLGINVTNIWIVANQVLFENYQFKLKNFASRASVRSFKAITDLHVGQSEIITKTVKGTNFICEQLVSEVNEAYLCHGTKYVEEIEKTGIDSRLFRDSGLYGRGAYFAESSTKSAQYAEPILNQGKQYWYMFVARVLLGEPFLCTKTDREMKRAPCLSGCKDSDGLYNCKLKGEGHSMCDSVVGTDTDFREFIVYNPEQSYPEFLVEYEHV